jgi:hypothetical protein
LIRAGMPQLEQVDRGNVEAMWTLHRRGPADDADDVDVGESDQGTADGRRLEMHRHPQGGWRQTPLPPSSRGPCACPSTLSSSSPSYRAPRTSEAPAWSSATACATQAGTPVQRRIRPSVARMGWVRTWSIEAVSVLTKNPRPGHPPRGRPSWAASGSGTARAFYYCLCSWHGESSPKKGLCAS